MNTLLEQIEERCKAVGFETQAMEGEIVTLKRASPADENQSSVGGSSIITTTQGRRLIRETKPQTRLDLTLKDKPGLLASIGDDDALEAIIDSTFEEFKPLDEFEAIWSSSKQTIECAIEVGSQRSLLQFSSRTLRRLSGISSAYDRSTQDNEVQEFRIEIPSPNNDVKIYLSPCSNEFAIWSGILRRWETSSFLQEDSMNKPDVSTRGVDPVIGRRMETRETVVTLRIEGIGVSSEQNVGRLLERVGNSLMFQIDLISNTPFVLTKRRQNVQRTVSRRVEHPFDFPKWEYDREPMALYWYGRTSDQTPLLRFLAFYQVLEFYFPVFSTKKAQESVKALLKDPRFDASSDPDITRLINAVKPHSSGRGFGKESEQIKDTIVGCVTASQMREFIESDERMVKFYNRADKKKMPIVETKVPLLPKESDIRPQVAERLFKIRCRIVHTKVGEDGSELLLPSSREASLLLYDTLLMEFIARQALIANSRALHLS